MRLLYVVMFSDGKYLQSRYGLTYKEDGFKQAQLFERKSNATAALNYFKKRLGFRYAPEDLKKYETMNSFIIECEVKET